MSIAQQQNPDGSWTDAEPYQPTCEHRGCKRHVDLNKDSYVRKVPVPGWENEPEALCWWHGLFRKRHPAT